MPRAHLLFYPASDLQTRTGMATVTPKRPKRAPTGEPADPIASARAAGLRHVSDLRPGISRRRSGKGFSYRDPDGRTIRDPATLRRIASLAIPPAWTDVWISPEPLGHIQATGRDARG